MEDKHRASFIHVRFYRFIVYRFIVFHYIFSLFISTNASKTINKHDLTSLIVLTAKGHSIKIAFKFAYRECDREYLKVHILDC